MTIVRGTHLVTDLRRAEGAARRASVRLAEAEQAMIESIERDGNIETLSYSYSIAWDDGLGRFRLVAEPIAFYGLPAEEVA